MELEPRFADYAVGSFSDDPPWTVEPDTMPWRAGIDDLRRRAAARVPDLVRVGLLPPVRGLRVVLGLSRVTIPWFVRNRRARGAPEAQAELARRLRPAFESLGPTFIKFGQLIASAEGVLPDPFVEEFRSCRDSVAPESFDHVREVIESDLGQPMKDLFEWFDETPIAAASIAQVHAARLVTGEDVVVKVQRPRIDKTISVDTATLAWIAAVIERFVPRVRIANISAYIELFADTVVEELDFRLEAQNMLDIAEVLARTDERSIVVPRPHPQLVTRRVLVMEHIRGHRLDDERLLTEAGMDPTAVLRALMVSFFEGAMIYGVFHGDMHGGNMVVTEDGRPALLDFGITGRLPVEQGGALLGLLVSAASQDTRGMLARFRDLGGFPPDIDLDELADELKIDERMGQDPAAADPEQMAVQTREMTGRFVALGAKIPKEIFLFIKGMLYLTGAAAKVSADLDMYAEFVHIIEVLHDRHGDHLAAFGIGPPPDRPLGQMGPGPNGMTLRERRQARGDRIGGVRGGRRRSAR